jgi:hypothetical protein
MVEIVGSIGRGLGLARIRSTTRLGRRGIEGLVMLR